MGCTHHTHHAHLQLKSSIKISIEAPKSNFAVCISDAVHLHVHVRRSRLQPGYAHYLLQLADLHTHSTGDVRNGRGAVRCARSPKGGPPSTTARCAGWLTTMSAREVTPLTEVKLTEGGKVHLSPNNAVACAEEIHALHYYVWQIKCRCRRENAIGTMHVLLAQAGTSAAGGVQTYTFVFAFQSSSTAMT